MPSPLMTDIQSAAVGFSSRHRTSRCQGKGQLKTHRRGRLLVSTHYGAGFRSSKKSELILGHSYVRTKLRKTNCPSSDSRIEDACL